MTALIIAVVGLLGVAGAAVFAARLRVAAPLILVVVGIGVSFLPFVPAVEVEPEWILAGVLPPLLYATAVSVPSMNFRRELNSIGGLSVVLVVLSAFLMGVFFMLVIPDLGFWWGVALGAIVSPTDAVATSIVKKSGVSGRVVSVLEGESLLNDATALVLLRAAIAGAAGAVSFWGVVGNFAYAVLIAAVFGVIVGELNLWLRSKVTDSTVNTVISFTVPFLASIPAELLGGSGLVAAVIAGLITGHGAARRLSPQHRLSDAQNWRTIELILEGAVFLLMGLELFGLVEEVRDEGGNIWIAILISLAALVLVLVVRAAYLTPLLVGLRRRARRSAAVRPHLDVMQARLQSPNDSTKALGPGQPLPALGNGRPAPAEDGEPEVISAFPSDGRGRRREFNVDAISPRRLQQLATRVRRGLADIDYLLQAPLGWREGGVLVWAGMRGAVTLAAAQTLPAETPNRSLLVLIAFFVAAASLLIQGSTLTAFVKWIKPAKPDKQVEAEERGRIIDYLREVANDVSQAEYGTNARDAATAAASSPAERKRIWLKIIAAQRTALLAARDDGIYAAEPLSGALASLDADQISIELKGSPVDL